MDKKEFKKYIDAFGKKPGEYTEREVYEICVTHKSLPKGDRDWSKLAEILDFGKTGEQLRNFTNYRQMGDGTLPKNTKQLSDRTINDLSYEEFTEEVEKQKRALYIQQTNTRDTMNSYRRMMRDDARADRLCESIKETIQNLKDLPEVKYKTSKKDLSGEAVLLVSDLHIGVNCDNFYNKYNSKIAADRLSKVVSDTIDYCKAHKVKRLNVLNLGDLIHGIIHISARVEQEFDVMTQVTTAGELLSNALVQLQAAAPEVVYRSVTDNHARILANKEESLAQENFGKLIDWYLEARLEKSGIIFANDNLDPGLGMFELLNGKKLAFCHGHEGGKNSMMQEIVGATKSWVDYICIGHYHSSAAKSFQDCRVFINGSIVGTEQYALSKHLFSTPAQKLIIFDGNTLDIDINLGDIK